MTVDAQPMDAAITGSWTKEVEQLVLSTSKASNRVLGVTAPRDGAGVTLTSRMIASSVAAAGRRALLVDLSARIGAQDPASARSWAPGDADVRRAVASTAAGYDLLAPLLTTSVRGRFNNIAQLTEALQTDLAGYDQIVVDLPAILDASHEQVNPVAAALACDAVYLLAATGVTTRHEARVAATQLIAAGAEISGVVLNDIEYETVGAEIVRNIGFLRRFAPEFHARLRKLALTSPLLN